MSAFCLQRFKVGVRHHLALWLFHFEIAGIHGDLLIVHDQLVSRAAIFEDNHLFAADNHEALTKQKFMGLGLILLGVCFVGMGS